MAKVTAKDVSLGAQELIKQLNNSREQLRGLMGSLRARNDELLRAKRAEMEEQNRREFKDRFDAAAPSQLKALAAVVTPAVNGVVADISPYKESRELVAIEGGDKRVVYLLNAKAFPEVVTVVEKLEVIGKANFADFENQGIAFEAMGEFFSARDAYAKAEKSNPESLTAKAGSKRVADALAGKKAVKESGAKQNKDTKFSK